jgi:hypothetical protein
MAATKRNAGLTSAIPRPTLNDEDLVRQMLYLAGSAIANNLIIHAPENTRLQEIPPGSYLSDIFDDASQLYAL